MTIEDAETWWRKVLMIHRDCGIDLSKVEAEFMHQASIRPGVKELFDYLDGNDIPSVILSAGVKNVIDMWCKSHNISPNLVLSTEFETDSDGKMTGWKEDTVIHVLNKAEISHPELNRLKAERPNIILVGDNVNDASMADGIDNIMRLRIVDSLSEGTTESDEIQRLTAERFDAVIQGGDMSPVRMLFDRIDAYSDAS